MPISEDQSIREVLGMSPVAVVGCSRSPEKDAHQVPAFLAERGYEIIPVNPSADEILGRSAYPSLADVPTDVGTVCVFRPSEEVPGIVDEAIERDDVAAIWLQLNIRHPAATARAEEAGIVVVEDRCMKIEHERLVGV